MHTLGVRGWFVHYDGDFSGPIQFSPPHPDNANPTSFTIPYEVVEAIVAEKMRREILSRIEDAKPSDILRLILAPTP